MNRAEVTRSRPAMDRRRFLRIALASGAGLLAARLIGPDWLDPAVAATASDATRYGPLGAIPDEHGLLLPEGFRSRLIGIGGDPVAGTSYPWVPFPDGAATYATDQGGWIYVANAEVGYPGKGGAGAVRFDPSGRIVDAYPILEGTTMNCSGGSTPWGTWLSGEEMDKGLVWECDPSGRRAAEPRPAMGSFPHECAVADPARRVLYLSEDHPEGLLYRFRPTTWGDLGEGTLEAASVDGVGNVSWVRAQDPAATSVPTRKSAPGATVFSGAEGLAISGDSLYLTTKYNNHIYRFDLAASKVAPVYRGDGVLTGVDNLTVHSHTGDLYVCEDGGDMQVVVITPDGTVAPFAQFVGHQDSEVTGIAFDPAGKRLYFSSQRAPSSKKLGDLHAGLVDARGLGRTFEVTGPFVAPAPPVTTTTQPKRPRRRKKARTS